MHKRPISYFLFCLHILFAHLCVAQSYTLKSPDGNIAVQVRVADRFYYSVSHKNTPVLNEAPIAMLLDNNPILLKSPKVKDTKTASDNTPIRPLVPVKNEVIQNGYQELKIMTRNDFDLVFRAFNNGVAYRWIYNGKGDYKIMDEQVNFQFAKNDTCYFQTETSFFSHNERIADKSLLSQVKSTQLGSLPVFVKQGDLSVVISESDLYDYAGLWLNGNEKDGFSGVFPKYPLTETQPTDRDRMVATRANYIASGSGTKLFPWRVMAIETSDAGVLTNQLVYQLNRSTTSDFSWVKPGKVAWDWYNYNNIYGVDFRAGINTATYKYYIDFAARNGLEYIILDEGWYDIMENDVTKVIPDINMQELIAYGKSKKVDIILWLTWIGLEKRMDTALDLYKSWGVAGIKVDFMQRDDQKMIKYYEEVTEKAAQRKLLVDFHGSYKPTGGDRLFPNLITREGVPGLENMKWDTVKMRGPDHNLTIPFIRMFAGPMDYTPGAMRNANYEDFYPMWHMPQSLGTRAHQVAMYVIYESPLQMLADAPTHYEREKECTDFISKVPTTWIKTVVKEAKIGNYIVMARKAKSGDWYVGAMTDYTKRSFTINCDFLDAGNYEVEIIQDGINADRNANDYKARKLQIAAGQPLQIDMAAGGGFTARFVRK
jgi:alpha-glucosidase